MRTSTRPSAWPSSRETAASKAKDAVLTRAGVVQARNPATARAESAVAHAAAEVLSRNPDDPAANLNMGRYRCITLGDWEAGLPLLAKGSDAELRALALKSVPAAGAKMDDTAAADQMLTDANGWWDWAERQPLLPRQRARQHTADLYRRATPKLSGLTKALATRRGEEVPALRESF